MIKQYLDSIVSMVESDDGISNQYVHRKTTVAPLFAIVLLIPALPIIILLLLMVRLTSRGPGIFKQLRVGKNGQTFTMYKIRTMVDHAEDGLGIVWSQKGDRRVTAVGRFIRNLHLDELPQLLNVVRGEMTLIGPRPERPEIVGNLIEKIPGYACRHRVMPGITGLAQINLPPDSDLSSVRKKLYLDLKYIKTANWLLDLRILMATSIRIFGIDGDGCAKLFGLHRSIPTDLLDGHGFKYVQDLGDQRSAERNGHDDNHFVPFSKVVEPNAEIQLQISLDCEYSDSMLAKTSHQSHRKSFSGVLQKSKTEPEEKKRQVTPKPLPARRPR